MTPFLLALSLIIHTAQLPNDSQKARNVLAGMYQQIFNLKTHSYQLESYERDMDNQTRYARMKIAVMENQPLRVSAEMLYPEKGPFIEYDESKNKDEALLTPKKWLPYVNFHVDIHGSMLRRGHHAINETSLHFFARLIQHCESHNGHSMDIQHQGLHTIKGQEYHLIELQNQNYQIQRYQIRSGENLITLGQRLHVSPFKILTLNPGFSDYQDVKAGDIIRIPSAYAKRCQIYVHTDSLLPFRIRVFDELGLFEQYIFTDINLNDYSASNE